jgi:hypothetical protein
MAFLHEHKGKRSLHGRVWVDSVDRSLYRKRIGNWECYRKTENGILAPSVKPAPGAAIIETMNNAPPEWAGAWDFRRGATKRGPVDVFFETRGSPNIPFWGIRPTHRIRPDRSNDPSRTGTATWVNWRAYGATNNAPTRDNDAGWVQWNGAWPGINIRVLAGQKGAYVTAYTTPRAAFTLDYTVLVPNDHTYSKVGDSMHVIAPDGSVPITQGAPSVYWSDSETPWMPEDIATSIDLDGTVQVAGKTYPLMRVSVGDTSHFATGTIEVY